MRKGFIAIALALLVAGSANAATWYWIARSQSNEDYFLDADTEYRSGDVVGYWLVSVNINPKKKYDSVASLEEVNCVSRKIRWLTYTEYLKGKILYSNDEATAWQHIVPGSIGQARLDYACKKEGDFFHATVLDNVDFPGSVAKVIQPLKRK